MMLRWARWWAWIVQLVCRGVCLEMAIMQLMLHAMARRDTSSIYMVATFVTARVHITGVLASPDEGVNAKPEMRCNVCTNIFPWVPHGTCPSCGSSDIQPAPENSVDE